MGYRDTSHIEFGISTPKDTRGEPHACIEASVPVHVFHRVKNAVRPSVFSAAKSRKVITVTEQTTTVPIISFKLSRPESDPFELEEPGYRARSIIKIFNALNSPKVVMNHERDPMLQVLMGLETKTGSHGLYSMFAGLALPNDLDVKAVATKATGFMKLAAVDVGYIPDSLPFEVATTDGRLTAVQLGGRALQSGPWQAASTGSVEARFGDINLKSHPQLLVCLAAMVGVVHATREFQENGQF